MRLAVSAIMIFGLVSSTGCVSSSHEDGSRVGVGWGLFSHERDYSYKALASNDPLAMELFRGNGYIAEDAVGIDYSIEGSKTSILWGLVTIKKD